MPRPKKINEEVRLSVVLSKQQADRLKLMAIRMSAQEGRQKDILISLKKSLNPLSGFDFGNLVTLKYAKQWQAKDSKLHETI